MSRFIRSAYNYDRAEVSRATASPGGGISKAQQQFKEECDINTIVRRFGLTGTVPVGFKMPMYGDFSQVTDFHTAMNVIRQAEDAFLTVPGELRQRFGHDPQKLMEFLGDSKNREEATKLGFFKVPDVPRAGPAAVPAVPAA